MWHSDRSLPQQALALTLSHLLLPLPKTLFIPFLRAFWTTIAREWTSIDALRMDKFLRLVRYYINSSFTYLSQHSWDEDLVREYVGLVEEWPLSAGNEKVGDGLRYHVLDVWVDELDGVDDGREGKCAVEIIMGPVRKLEREGRVKKVRERAGECLGDERLRDWEGGEKGATAGKRDGDEMEDEEWDGLDD
jgi:ribosomal RNA-processing protein 1